MRDLLTADVSIQKNSRGLVTGSARSPGGDIAALRKKLRKFADDRDWQKYHHPRNLVLALVGEVGELSEIFQWLGDDEAARIMEQPRLANRVREELADVFSYLLRLSDVLDIDIGEALESKMRLNAERYPIDRAAGNACKYTELGGRGRNGLHRG